MVDKRRLAVYEEEMIPTSVPSRIRILPELLVRKIAAGEVVERPASVVRELLDNAIDVAATRVTVAVEDGGRALIRVTDDGCGMSAEELALAVKPHATSKIADVSDLSAIETLGFRGEALASISAVSRLRIVSRQPDSEEGNEIRVTADQVESARAAGCPPGTTVEVRDLFFNVPARRKFLRAKSTEVGHVNEQITRAALAWPAVGFELTNNGRTTLNFARSQNRLQRIAAGYSNELADALLHVEREERGLQLDAYVAPPSYARATPQWQFAFVNGRFIRDRYIQHAIKEAHRGLMEPSRHGVVFLFLTIDPAEVDVNVHPTKAEVRWADSHLIHSQVLSALRESFQAHDLTPSLRTDRPVRPVDPAEQERIRREMAEAFKSAPPLQPGASSGPIDSQQSGAGPYSSHPADAWASRAEGPFRRPVPAEAWRELYAPPSPRPLRSDDGQPPLPMTEAVARPPRAIQLHNLYLVAETDDGIVIVDQHALHERVMYEQLRERIARGPLESQRLLLPETVRVTPQEMALVESHAAFWTSLGIELTPFAADTIAVHSFPSLLKDIDVTAFLRDVLDRLEANDVAGNPEETIQHVLSMMACKAAVKAGDPLTDDEVQSLMKRRHLVERSSSCPHGRPTMLRFTKADLERQFKRT